MSSGQRIFQVACAVVFIASALAPITPVQATTPPLAVLNTGLPDATVAHAYQTGLYATGGYPVYTWTIAQGALPVGLSLNPTGVISGTPAIVGASTFTARVTDTHMNVATKVFTLAVQATPNPTITTTNLPEGLHAQSYQATLAATGGSPPYAWGTTGGQLPPGITLTPLGQFSGTPLLAGTYNFTVSVTDHLGGTASRALAIMVQASTLQITTPTVPNGATGTHYDYVIDATGGTTPYTWSSTASVPPGLVVTPMGHLQGTPVAGGSYSFQVQIIDALGHTATRTYTMEVAAPAPLEIHGASILNATTGLPYVYNFTAQGGLAPYAWAVGNGTLPAGLTLNPATGQIAGTPLSHGVTHFTLAVLDTQGTTSTQQETLSANCFGTQIGDVCVPPDACPPPSMGVPPTCICPPPTLGLFPDCISPSCENLPDPLKHCEPNPCPTGQVGFQPECKTECSWPSIGFEPDCHAPCQSDAIGAYEPACFTPCPAPNIGFEPDCQPPCDIATLICNPPQRCDPPNLGLKPVCLPPCDEDEGQGYEPVCLPIPRCDEPLIGTPPACFLLCSYGVGVDPICLPVPFTPCLTALTQLPPGGLQLPPEGLVLPPACLIPPQPCTQDTCTLLPRLPELPNFCATFGWIIGSCPDPASLVPTCTPGVGPAKHQCLPVSHPFAQNNATGGGPGSMCHTVYLLDQIQGNSTPPLAGATGCSPFEPAPFANPLPNTPYTGGVLKTLCGCGAAGNGAGAGGTIDLYNGQLKLQFTPADLPAQRGFDFQFNVTYQSRNPNATALDGSFGPHWDYNYGMWLEEHASGVTKHDGAGIATEYTRSTLTGALTAPMGSYDRLDPITNAAGVTVAYHLTDRYGWIRNFTRDDLTYPFSATPSNIYVLTNIKDPNENRAQVWPSHAVADTQERLIFMDVPVPDVSDEARAIAEYKRVDILDDQWLDDTQHQTILDRYGHAPVSTWNYEIKGHIGQQYPYSGQFPWHWESTQELVLDSEGHPVLDADGNTVYQTVWHNITDAHSRSNGAGGHEWLAADYYTWEFNWTTGNWDIYDWNGTKMEIRHAYEYWTQWSSWDPVTESWIDGENKNATLDLRYLATFDFDQTCGLKSIQLPGQGSATLAYDPHCRPESIQDGEAQTYLVNTFDDHDRITEQLYGYGTYHLAYDDYDCHTRVTDRNGNIVDYYCQNRALPLTVKKVAWSNRNMNWNDPANFVTTWAYNQNGEVTMVHYPRGNLEEFVWDDTNPNYLSQGNLLCHIRDPGPFVTDNHGEPQLPLITKYTYEETFNHPVTMEDARGSYPNFRPPNGGQQSEERYTTHYTYEYQVAGGVQHPNLIEVDYPIVNPNGPPHDAFTGDYGNQVRKETWTYTTAGQGKTHIDLMGTQENWTYFQHEGWLFNVTDAEGYIQQHIRDVNHFHIVTDYTRDLDGNPTTITDGNGVIELTFAARCLLTGVKAPSPLNYETNIERDNNGRPTSVSRDEDTGAQATTEGTSYDILGNVIQKVQDTARPADAPSTTQATVLTTAYCYDLNDNRVLERRPESMNGHQFADYTSTIFDERDQAIGTTRGHMNGEFWNQPRSSMCPDFEDPACPNTPTGACERIPCDTHDLYTNYTEPSHGFAQVALFNGCDVPAGWYEARYVAGAMNEIEPPQGNHTEGYSGWFVQDPDAGATSIASLGGHVADLPGNFEGYPTQEEAEVSNAGASTLFYWPGGVMYAINGEFDGVDDVAGHPNPTWTIGCHNVTAEQHDGTVWKDYDENGNLVREKDGMGYVTTYQYDGYDRQNATIDALGGRSEKRYDPVDNVIVEAFCGASSPGLLPDPEALSLRPITRLVSCLNTPLPQGTQLYTKTLHSYDEAKRSYRTDQLFQDLTTGVPLMDGPTSVQRVGPVAVPDGFVTSLTQFDAAGHTVRSVNDNLHASDTTYNSLGLVERTRDAANNTVYKDYDAQGNFKNDTHTDVNQEGWLDDQVWTSSGQSDVLGRQTAHTDASGATSQTTYNAAGDQTAQTSPAGVQVTHVYDGLSRLLRDHYDASWITTAWSKPAYSIQSADNQYDIGSLVNGNRTVTLSDGVTTYTFAGDVTESTLQVDNDPPPGTHTVYVISGYHWVSTNTTHPKFLNIDYDYDGDGRLVSMKDGLGQVTTYAYDELGRKVQEVAPDSTAQTFAYDYNDQVVTFTDPNGNVVTSTYDRLNRPIHVHAELGSGVIGTTDQSYAYDAQGRKVAEWDDDNHAGGAHAYLAKAYDSLGNTVLETENGQTGTSTYDGVGNRVTYTFPNGRAMLYTYDSLEQPKQVWSLGLPNAERVATGQFVLSRNGVPWQRLPGDELIANYTYIGPSHVNSRAYYGVAGSEIMNRTLGYDAAHRLHDIHYAGVSTTTPLSFTYTYDVDGRLTRKDKTGADDVYMMDHLGRLTEYTKQGSDADLKREQWSLDDANNWASYNRTTSATTHYQRNHASTNAVTSETATVGATSTPTSYTYDANGNLLDDEVHVYKWDFKNRLREVDLKGSPNTFVAAYMYDAENRRVQTAGPVQSTIFFLDGMNEVQEQDCNGVITRQYVYGRGTDELLAQDVPKLGVRGTDTLCLQQHGAPQDPVQQALACQPTGFPRVSCGPCRTQDAQNVACSQCLQSAQYPAGANVTLPPPTPDCVSCSVQVENGPVLVPPDASAFTADYASCSPCLPTGTGFAMADSTPSAYASGMVSDACVPCTQDQQGVLALAWTSQDPMHPYVYTAPPEPVVQDGGNLVENQEGCAGVYIGLRMFFLQDEQMSVYGLADISGRIIQGMEYDPYGHAYVYTHSGTSVNWSTTSGDTLTDANHAATPYLYTGRRYDAESGLYYYRSRFLDEHLGRFISKDTIGVWEDMSSLGNSFALCSNTPTYCSDPMGTCGEWWNWIVVCLFDGAALVTQELIDIGKHIGRDVQGLFNEWSTTGYGNFCGGSVSSKTERPLDELDTACFVHDKCLEVTPDVDGLVPFDSDAKWCNQELVDNAALSDCYREVGQAIRINYWRYADKLTPPLAGPELLGVQQESAGLGDPTESPCTAERQAILDLFNLGLTFTGRP